MIKAYLPFNKNKIYSKFENIERENEILKNEINTLKYEINTLKYSIIALTGEFSNFKNDFNIELNKRETERQDDIAYKSDFYSLREYIILGFEEEKNKFQLLLNEINLSKKYIGETLSAIREKVYLGDRNLKDFQSEMINYKDQFRLMFWELYRKDDETDLDARKRFFLSLPENAGDIRVLQVLENELLKALHRICEENNLKYWLWGGSLLGSVRHKGFIPWDDDVDLGMMRADIDKLLIIMKDNEEYEIKIRYDAYVFCKQIRFKYKDEKNPVFIDIFVFDYCNNINGDVENRKLELKSKLYTELGNMTNPRIKEFCEKGLVDEDSELGLYIKSIFDRYIKLGFKEEIMLDEGSSIIYSIENYQPQKAYANEVSVYLPTKKGIFEKEDYNIPNDEYIVLKQIYSTLFDFPNGKSHFVHIDINGEIIEYLRGKFNIK